MEKNGNRPQRINADQVDGAIDEALQRVEQIEELPLDELDKVSGGKLPVQTTGFLPVEN